MSATAPSEAQVTPAFLSLTTPLSGVTMTPISFWAEETLTNPFVVTIEATAEQRDIDPTEFLYHPVCLSLAVTHGPTRYFNGIVRRFMVGEPRFRGGWTYSMEVVPRLWFLSQTHDCRIFQQQTSEQIIATLLQESGVAPVQWRFSGNKPAVHEYTVQMNETDLDFVTRLMQQEGWFYYFEHTATAHTLVIADTNTPFQRIPNPQVALGTSQRLDALHAWKPVQTTTYGQTALKDYDPTVPNKSLQATHDTIEHVAGAKQRDFFRWPALSYAVSQVDQRTRLIMEAAEASSSLIAGMGQHNGFIPGGKFILKQDPNTGATDQEYVVRSVVHQGSGNTGVTGGYGATYGNSFTCFPNSRTWRERLTIPRPRMSGIYSAIVIGNDQEDIHTDRFARVKVLFQWDWRKDSTADSAIWLRVVQPWAGNGNWGWQFIPRVGSEVAVAFMDGDADRPVVVGGMYNGDNMPPFLVPDQKTLSGIKTRSTPKPKDGAERYHLLRFDDAYECEQILLRSQARLDLTAFANSYETIYGYKHVKVAQATDKTGNTFGGCMYSTVDAEYDLHVGGNRYQQVDKNDQLTVNGDISLDFKGQWTAVIDGATSIAANSVVIEATNKITLKVGGSWIVIGPCGVYINGPMVYINSGGSPDSSSPVTMQDVADATLAEPGDKPAQRMTPCNSNPGSGGQRTTRTDQIQPAPPCTQNTGSVNCNWLGDDSNDASVTC